MNKEERKIYIRKHYQDNKEYYLLKAVEARKRVVKWFRDYKATLSCSNCPENHPACLEFHHLDPKQKDFEVSKMINQRSKKAILKEISKCIILCSNCHRKLHHEARLESK